MTNQEAFLTNVNNVRNFFRNSDENSPYFPKLGNIRNIPLFPRITGINPNQLQIGNQAGRERGTEQTRFMSKTCSATLM
jgi:hypothetical protein